MKRRNGIIQAATSAGKTEIFAAAIKILSLKTLIIINGNDLLSQTKERLEERLGIKIGLISGKTFEPGDVTVVSVQTIASIVNRKRQKSKTVSKKKKKSKVIIAADERKSRLERFKSLRDFMYSVQFLVGDEVQFAQAQSWKTAIDLLPNIYYRLGLSARPFSLEDLPALGSKKLVAQDLNIVCCFGPVISKIRSSELIEKGRIARPHIMLLPIRGPVNDDLPYPDARKKLLVRNKTRNDLIEKHAKEMVDLGLLVLIIVGPSRKHGKILDKRLSKHFGDSVHYLNGSTKKEWRDQVRKLANVDREKVKVIITTVIWDLGVSVPNIGGLILAGGGKEPRRTIQRLGRVLRKKEDVNIAHVIDFIDAQNPHLRRHSIARLKEYLAEEAYIVELVDPDSHIGRVKNLVKQYRRAS